MRRPRQSGHQFADHVFKCFFLNANFQMSNKIPLKYVPRGVLDNNVSIGSNDGLASNRWQAIIWSNDDPVHWHIYASSGLNELTHWGQCYDLLSLHMTRAVVACVVIRLFQGPTHTTSSRCLVVLWTIHTPWNLLEIHSDIKQKRKKKPTHNALHWGKSYTTPNLFMDLPITTVLRTANQKPW